MIQVKAWFKENVECGFRLLNSEIGNDPRNGATCFCLPTSFRLLNSEIGNDRKLQLSKKMLINKAVFVSLTRR